MYKITEKQFKEMPVELQALYEKLPNPSSDEVVSLFPNTKGSNATRTNSPESKQVYGDYGKVSTQSDAWGDSGSAARYFYCAKASKSERNKGCEELESKERVRQGLAGEKDNTYSKNSHPTVKPIALMEYLVKLISREGATVLDPFMGSGSTGIACRNLNRNFIGIEKEAEYIKIAEARINKLSK